jgi:hypothetical protein
VDVFGGTDVDAACRLGCEKHRRSTGQLAGQDQLLDVSTRQVPRRRLERGRLDGEALDEVGRPLNDPAQPEQSPTAIRIPVVLDEHHILGDGEFPDHPVAHPFLGDVGQAGGSHPTWVGVGHVLAVDEHPPRHHWPQPGYGLCQLALPVARHARDAKDLAGAHLQAEVVDSLGVSITADGESFEQKTHLA